MECKEETSHLDRSNPGIWYLLLTGVTIRWIVSFYDYSGYNTPPMYGDYEAQRHWMEVTVNLPVEEWYTNSSRNDLQYWGLDYPPLTAYHSLVCGYFALLLNPAYVELNTSKGYESSDHKLFMRSTVLVSDIFTYVLAAGVFSKISKSPLLLVVMLLYPGIILIDHGHFQYNCVSLGLALYSYTAFLMNYDILGSIFFCLALNFKQMLLYYSLPVFFYLLGKCLKRDWKKSLYNLLILGATVILCFLILWLPFLSSADQVIKRIFPIERGLFEDKVSNLWCLINIFIKVNNYLSKNHLALISAVFTLTAVLPSCVDLFLHPNPRKFTLSLINSSLAFYLFSYQVHEKTILVVSLPIMLFYQQDTFHCLWFLMLSSLSMLPLLIKDNLLIPFISLNIIYIIMCLFVATNTKVSRINIFSLKSVSVIISSFVSFILIILSTCAPTPQSYPHIYPLVTSAFCALHFSYFYVYFNWVQLKKIKKK